jgi:phospholipid/cholesterol/gamma-HCH transport system substrate-binding protein
MATPRQKVQVGIFLTICCVLLVGILVVVSGWRGEETVPYVVVFDESVSGLFPGSDVRYRGVPVGRVTEIKVMPNNRIQVRIAIRPSVIRVRQGMTATLGTTGVTGQLYVDLSGGEPDAPSLAPNHTIPSTPSLFANLSAELPILLASINGVLVRLDNALGEGGQIAIVMQDTEALLTSLRDTVAELGPQAIALLRDSNTLVRQDAQRLLQELTTTAQTTRHVLRNIEPPLKSTLESSSRTFKLLEQQLAGLDLPSTNAKAQITFDSLSQLAQQFSRTSDELTATLQQLRGTTSNTEFHIRQAVKSLRETLLSAKQLLDYLEQDPTALLVGKRQPVAIQDGQ